MSAFVGIEGDDLVVRLSGWDAVWAIGHGRRVPLAHVTGARVESRRDLRAGLRMGGTSLPGRINVGRFWSRSEGWSFWWVHRASEVVVVDLRDERDRRLVLEVENPHALAGALTGPRA